ncbi:MAG TPA: glycosyltransferase family 2 protein [Cyclobacteriaceae bacterium]
MQKVSIVIPVHNEEGNIFLMIQTLIKIFDSLPYSHEIIFVNDGSTDHTAEVLKSASMEYNIFYIELSRNFGHQNALKAGLDHVNGDCTISLDGDFQHPPTLIPRLLQKWEEGYEIVYTKRRDFKDTPRFKRFTSRLFYKVINKLSDIKIEEGSADFRLMDSKVIEAMKAMPENDLFIRGLVKWIGFKQYGIEYNPDQRFSGKSKYTLSRMIKFAVQGISAFSIRPLYAAIFVGLFFSTLSLFAFIPYVIISLMNATAVSGWASIITTIVFFGGLNLTTLGVIGIYVGKVFMQSKSRPNYFVRETNIIKYDTAKF